MFKTTSPNGFHMKFTNGCTVSVQWNPGSYISDRSGKQDEHRESNDAEVAAWRENGDWIKLSEHDDVVGWQSPRQVMEIMEMVAAL